LDAKGNEDAEYDVELKHAGESAAIFCGAISEI